MDRVESAAEFLVGGSVRTLLDVGCRGGELRRYLPTGVNYSGCDLVAAPHVTYVGDVQKIDIDELFDVVVALDILEHVDDLHGLFDKLLSLSKAKLVVSLPNCYDLKGRWLFSVRGSLGGKYRFTTKNVLDRHRWLMSYTEIHDFYRSKANEFGLTLETRNVKYGDSRNLSVTSAGGLAIRALGPALSTSAVIGSFTKP